MLYPFPFASIGQICHTSLEGVGLTPSSSAVDPSPSIESPAVQAFPAGSPDPLSPERDREREDGSMSRPWRQLVHYIVQKRGGKEVDGGRQAMGRWVREGASINGISPRKHLSPLGFAVCTNQYKVVKVTQNIDASIICK